ncbi:complexin-1 [Calypte anna]|uniref:complexin-1 n=1 Tax=Calypte anna TaxID=9244 RepID=UPI0011C47F5C|nr:complexin-1 [Calypte anna]
MEQENNHYTAAFQLHANELSEVYTADLLKPEDVIQRILTAMTQVYGATKDMGKMLGGDEEKDPDAAKKEEERQEALRQEEEERKAKYAKMEAEREVMRQGIRDKYGIKKKEEKEAEAQAALEANAEGSLTRPKKAIPPGCGDEEEEEEESILDTVIKYLPGPLQDMFKK